MDEYRCLACRAASLTERNVATHIPASIACLLDREISSGPGRFSTSFNDSTEVVGLSEPCAGKLESARLVLTGNNASRSFGELIAVGWIAH